MKEGNDNRRKGKRSRRDKEDERGKREGEMNEDVVRSAVNNLLLNLG